MSEPEVWNILTMKDGVVSLLKNLTENECREAVQRLQRDDPWSAGAIYRRELWHLGRDIGQGLSGIGYISIGATTSPGWAVDRCEWWGSRGGSIEIWPKPDDYDDRLAEARRVADAIMATNTEIEKRCAA